MFERRVRDQRSHPVSEAELVRALADGSDSAMAALYQLHGGLIYRFCLRMVQNESIAEEVTQDVFLALLRQSRQFDPQRAALATWLCGVARRLVWKQLQQQQRHLPLETLTGEQEMKSADDDPITLLSRREAVSAVQRGIEALPLDDMREVTPDAADALLIRGSENTGANSRLALSPAFGNNRMRSKSLYHGNAGVIMDHSALDARPFSLTGQNSPQLTYDHVTGVLSIGGPLRIPQIPRTGANFVVNYQWLRNRNANLQTALMPTGEQRQGDLSQSMRLFADPLNGAPFPGGVIPASRISPQANALPRLYPLPNFENSTRYNYQLALAGITHQDNLQARLDQKLRRGDSVAATLDVQSTRSDDPTVFGFLDRGQVSGLNSSFNWRHTFNARFYGTARLEFSRLAVRTVPHFANRNNVSAEAGITGNNQEPVNWGPPNLSFSNGTAPLADANPSFNRNQTTGFSYRGLWNHGAHNVSFGAGFRRQQYNSLAQQDPRGTFTFSGAATQVRAGGTPASDTGSDFADFLLGIPDTSTIAFGNADKYFRSAAYDSFVNDDWRLFPGFTLNAGVRWEYATPVTELRGRLVNLAIGPEFTSATPVVANGSGSASLLRPDKRGYQPRVAVAWRPRADSSLVLRAGYGVYYNTSVYQSIATQMAQQPPLSKTLSVENSSANPLTLANGFRESQLVSNTFGVDSNFRVGYAQNWQLSAQRDLPGALVLSLSYLGIKGTRGMQSFLPNTVPIGAINPCPACPIGFTYLTSNGNSTREAGQIQVRRRLRSGFTSALEYSYSKSIDNAALGGRGQGGSLVAQNWLDLNGERGLSNFDQRQQLSLQTQYSSGMGFGGGTLRNGWTGMLLKEWTLATQLSATSGLPLTPIYPAATPGTGITGNLRPNVTGIPVYSATGGGNLNPAAYALPKTGQWGNAGRNSLKGPRQLGFNASLGRTFRLSDRWSSDFRIDATNVFNHPTFPSWNSIVTSPQFGLPGTANPMRTLQSTVRVRF